MNQTTTVEGSGPDGVLTVGDLRELLAQLGEADTDRTLKGRTTLGGKLKALTISRDG